MKRVSGVVVCAILAMSATCWALPPVTLNPACTYVYDVATGFNSQAASLFAILGAAGIEGLPTDWHDADLENGMLGDGIPDYVQLGLLGAVLCDGNAGVLAQFNANKAAYLALVSGVGAMLTDATTMQAELAATGADLTTWLDAPQAALGGLAPRAVLGANVALVEAVAAGCTAGAEEVGGFVTQYGQYVGLLGNFAPIFAGLGGLSSEMYATFQNLVDVQLLGGLADVVTELNTLRDGCAGLVAGVPTPPMTTTLSAELTATAAAINTVTSAMTTLTLPAFEIYGTAKTDSEPFSGAGDYNGNGDTNLQVYTTVVANGGGSVADFVAASSGANSFYPGAAGLPVAGLLGLSLLASAFGVVGAFSIRKK